MLRRKNNLFLKQSEKILLSSHSLSKNIHFSILSFSSSTELKADHFTKHQWADSRLNPIPPEWYPALEAHKRKNNFDSNFWITLTQARFLPLLNQNTGLNGNSAHPSQNISSQQMRICFPPNDEISDKSHLSNIGVTVPLENVLFSTTNENKMSDPFRTRCSFVADLSPAAQRSLLFHFPMTYAQLKPNRAWVLDMSGSGAQYNALKEAKPNNDFDSSNNGNSKCESDCENSCGKSISFSATNSIMDSTSDSSSYPPPPRSFFRQHTPHPPHILNLLTSKTPHPLTRRQIERLFGFGGYFRSSNFNNGCGRPPPRGAANTCGSISDSHALWRGDERSPSPSSSSSVTPSLITNEDADESVPYPWQWRPMTTSELAETLSFHSSGQGIKAPREPLFIKYSCVETKLPWDEIALSNDEHVPTTFSKSASTAELHSETFPATATPKLACSAGDWGRVDDDDEYKDDGDSSEGRFALSEKSFENSKTHPPENDRNSEIIKEKNEEVTSNNNELQNEVLSLIVFNAQETSDPFSLDPSLCHRHAITGLPMPQILTEGLTSAFSLRKFRSLRWIPASEIASNGTIPTQGTHPSSSVSSSEWSSLKPLRDATPIFISVARSVSLLHISQLPTQELQERLRKRLPSQFVGRRRLPVVRWGFDDWRVEKEVMNKVEELFEKVTAAKLLAKSISSMQQKRKRSQKNDAQKVNVSNNKKETMFSLCETVLPTYHPTNIPENIWFRADQINDLFPCSEVPSLEAIGSPIPFEFKYKNNESFYNFEQVYIA